MNYKTLYCVYLEDDYGSYPLSQWYFETEKEAIQQMLDYRQYKLKHGLYINKHGKEVGYTIANFRGSAYNHIYYIYNRGSLTNVLAIVKNDFTEEEANELLEGIM